MKKNSYLIRALDDEGCLVSRCVRAFSADEAEILFYAETKMEIIETIKLEDGI